MIATVQGKSGRTFKVDLSKSIDISLPLGGENPVSAFYIAPVEFKAFEMGGFIGDVSRGGSCNVFTITFNPHGNGTHTETAGHIVKEKYPVNDHLKQFFFEARVVTIQPLENETDRFINAELLKERLHDFREEALVIRMLPNGKDKRSKSYSGTNPAYLTPDAAAYLSSIGVLHLILDVPSIDREEDGGKLAAHKEFWNVGGQIRSKCTITEMAFIPDEVEDGHYLLNLMIASFVNDASPSKPVLYKTV